MKTIGVIGICSLAFLFGCQSKPDSRIAKNQAAFDSYPVNVQQNIKAGNVAVGFTPEQVTMARGKPDSVEKRTTARGESEVWVYEKRSSGLSIGLGVGGGSGGVGGGVGVSSGGRGPSIDMRVVFEGGVVSAIEKNEK